jgi:large subunit ribosomal protein L15
MADEKKAAEKAAPAAEKKTAAKAAPKAEKAAAPKAATKSAAADKSATADKTEKKAPAKSASKSAASKAPAAKADDTKAAPKKADAKGDGAETTREHVLKVHHLRPAAGAKKDRTRVGRGEGSKGKTAGRGTKGTKARYQVRPGFQGGQLPLHMRVPKLRGFKNPFRVEYQVVNLDKLAELYPGGGDVTVGDLVAKGAVRKNEKVKVLGNGEIAVKLNVAVDKVSGSAEQKIVAAGGSVN